MATRFGASAMKGTTVAPEYSKYASSTATIEFGFARARAASSAGSRSAPVGLLGLQTQITSARPPASTTSAPSIPVAMAYKG
jgi:hypothetical protein